MIHVDEPGVLATVQDLGRPGHGHLGVPVGGAADRWSHALANLLVGNGVDAATIEVTLGGARFTTEHDAVVALAGADLPARIDPGGRRLRRGLATRVRAGETLTLEPSSGAGARAYLAVRGGFDVPLVLGSRSTCLIGRFGGLDGRPLRAGDRLPVGGGRADDRDPPGEPWPGEPMAPRRVDREGVTRLRVLPGLEQSPNLVGGTWRAAGAPDRMGLRLEPAVAEDPERSREPGATALVTSHGVVEGAVQLPPDGRPIVLLAEHQPTGGYPVVAVVIGADLGAAAQIAPGDRIAFEAVDLPAARHALEEQRQAWASGATILAIDAAWHDLWLSAGA